MSVAWWGSHSDDAYLIAGRIRVQYAVAFADGVYWSRLRLRKPNLLCIWWYGCGLSTKDPGRWYSQDTSPSSQLSAGVRAKHRMLTVAVSCYCALFRVETHLPPVFQSFKAVRSSRSLAASLWLQIYRYTMQAVVSKPSVIQVSALWKVDYVGQGQKWPYDGTL